MARKKKRVMKHEKLHRILGITTPTITHKDLIDLAIAEIPDLDWSIKQIIERLNKEGIEVIQEGRYNASCVYSI